ncbi:uncharacterized mitochondrial protein-like protein [Tanacetum coccineum]
MPALEDYSIFDFSRDDEDDGAVTENPRRDPQKAHISSTKKELCNAFEKLMHEKFQMSSMGELTFFLGLQVQQKKDGIFISQDKYVVEILKKFRFTEVKTASTPMETQKPLLKDEDGKQVDVHMYRSMIGSLMYLTSSRPDIMFVVCACARYQVNLKVSHHHAVKRIFSYLKGQPKLGLWYPKDSPFDLVAYTYSDYAGACLDRKSTIGGCQFLGCRLISWQCKKQTVVANSTTEAEYVVASSCCGQVLWIQNQLLDYGYNFMHTKIFIDNNRKAKKSVRLIVGKLFEMELELMLAKTINGEQQLHALVDGKKVIITESNVRKGTSTRIIEEVLDCLPNATIFENNLHIMPSGPTEHVADEAVHKELGDSLVRAATSASSLEAEQDSGNITKTRSKATPNESSSLGTTSGGGPRRQETMGDIIAQTRFENVSKLSNDLLLARGNTLRRDKDRLKLDELMELCTNLQKKVLDLEKTKTTQANEIASLKRRVKKLEKKRSSRTHKLKRLYKVGLSARVESSGDEEDLGEDASKQGRRINAIDADEDITLVNVQDDADNEMFDVNVLNGEEVFVAGQNENVVEEVVDAAQVSTAATTVTITTEEITLAQALEALKTSKPKVKGIVFQEPGKSTTTTTISSQQSQDKGKGIMIEEPVKPMKKKDLIRLDEEVALKLQAEFDEEERLAREKA